ncbi:hypothetical protein FUAX_19800 [Fulvitalea axinellae]|uniref:DUF5689 domain-containing protein n=1 Tax=Fulvitalea axinellae TaxID=1182444 RepID=A0AAU9D0W4_9BACT|nr:hypothetical protein FUAX_19800 [Fulvitalea axinellae]
MKYRYLNKALTLCACLFAVALSSCEIEADAPKAPDKTANTDFGTAITFADLKGMIDSENYAVITENRFIEGFVIANNETNNFYKKIKIQGDNQGAEVKLNFTKNAYKVGDHVKIALKGLNLNKYTDLQIGSTYGSADDIRFGGIDEDAADTIIRVTAGSLVEPKLLTSEDLNDDALNTLVKFDQVQFDEGDLGETFADPQGESKYSVNRSLVFKNGSKVIVRTSNAATFASMAIPGGSGSIAGVLGKYGKDFQLFIMDPAEIKMEGDRFEIEKPEIDFGTEISITELKGLIDSENYKKIEEARFVQGTVVANADGGNFYKQFTFQAGEEGAVVKINTTKVPFAIGQKVKIALKGLYLNKYADLQIGSTYVDSKDKKTKFGGIDEGDIESKIEASAGTAIAPKTVTIAGLFDGMLNTLVTVNDVQVVDGDLNKSFAEPKQNTNRTLETCDGEQLVLRTSGYSKFAGETLPSGKGSITGILGKYGSTYQLFIRNTADINMAGERCTTDGGGNEPATEISIADLKQKIDGTQFVQINENLFVEGTVIANAESGNFYKQFTIQAEGEGAIIKINTTDLPYTVGQKVKVKLKGLHLNKYADLQIGSTYVDSKSGDTRFGGIDKNKLSEFIEATTGTAIEPTTVTIDGLTDTMLNTLVKFEDLQFKTTGEIYAKSKQNTNRTLTTCDGKELVLRTSGYAKFAGETVAEGKGSIVGVLSKYKDTYQLYIRDLNDVDMTGDRCE